MAKLVRLKKRLGKVRGLDSMGGMLYLYCTLGRRKRTGRNGMEWTQGWCEEESSAFEKRQELICRARC